ncbi:hypothetical protein I142_10275, partial [Pasteurella multocida RIIF]
DSDTNQYIAKTNNGEILMFPAMWI